MWWDTTMGLIWGLSVMSVFIAGYVFLRHRERGRQYRTAPFRVRPYGNASWVAEEPGLLWGWDYLEQRCHMGGCRPQLYTSEEKAHAAVCRIVEARRNREKHQAQPPRYIDPDDC